jgi:hypothetical protein
MALTESTRALAAAIDKVIAAAGDDPKHKELVGKLTAVRDEVAGESAPTEKRDGEDDSYSFETAQKRHGERLAASRNEAAGAGTDGAAGTGGEGK